MTRASSQTKGRVLTFEEYMAGPEMKARHEVVDGVVIIMSPPPNVYHQLILTNLSDLISPYVRRRRLGTVIVAPCGLLIRKTPKLRVREPDLMFFSRQRISRQELKQALIVEVTPDIAIEIRSPGNRGKRWMAKLADYASIGLPEFWLVNPRDKSVEVYPLVEGRYDLEGRYENDDALHSRFLPGLALRVSAFFE
jgi:Uma2 family endonuclease